MSDYQKALAAAREALALFDSAKPRTKEADSAAYELAATSRDLIAAIDAARVEVVAGYFLSGSVAIPFWVIDYAQKIELFMRVNGVDEWAIGGIQSRNLPPPQAPPAPAVPDRNAIDDAIWRVLDRHNCKSSDGRLRVELIEAVFGVIAAAQAKENNRE